MSEHIATVRWQRSGDVFTDGKYHRAHVWEFDGGAVVPGSSSPASVRLPFSDVSAVDPEEAFVASLSSCHMLWFLALAAKRRFAVDSYEDQAVGVLGELADGRKAMTVVSLRPRVIFSGERRPSATELDELHHEAHLKCYIANSVTTEVRCEPVG